MNITRAIRIFLAFIPLCASAQESGIQARLQVITNVFNALPKSERLRFTGLKQKAREAQKQEKFFTCLITISDAEVIFSQDPELLYLKGMCLAQIQDVDKAIESYKKVLFINPSNVMALMNMVEINYFAVRYKESIKYINRINEIAEGAGRKGLFPLMDFKHLIILTKLTKEAPDEYKEELKKVGEKYTYMDDSPFYYYKQALSSLISGDKHEGLIWIYKAYYIFKEPEVIKNWNKALVDTGYIGAHEILFSVVDEE